MSMGDIPQAIDDAKSVTSSQYAAVLNNPKIKFVIEDLGEEVEEVEESLEEDEYFDEYGEEESKEDPHTSFNVEVELGDGEKRLIKLTEEEYSKIFNEGDQGLLISKIKELKRDDGVPLSDSDLTSENTHFSQKKSSSVYEASNHSQV